MPAESCGLNFLSEGALCFLIHLCRCGAEGEKEEHSLKAFSSRTSKLNQTIYCNLHLTFPS